MTTLDDSQLAELAGDLSSRVAARVPEWTGTPGEDPGVVLLELFAFLSEALRGRGDLIPERHHALLARAVWSLRELGSWRSPVEVWVDGEVWRPVASLTGVGPHDPVYLLDPAAGTIRFGDGVEGRRPPTGASIQATYRHGDGGAHSVTHRWPLPRASYAIDLRANGEIAGRVGHESEAVDSVLERVHYFTGQLLSAEDFQAEQDYVREKQRRHHRHLHGFGVVQGLEVSAEEGGVHVSAGLAIDANGEELVVAVPWDGRIPTGSAWYVTLAFAECEIDPVPALGKDAPPKRRVQEGFRISFASSPPAGAVALGRLVCGPGGWSLDPDFTPPRAR